MTLACWVFIMVRSDLTGMLTDYMLNPVSCGQTPSAWLEEFSHCDLIRNTEQWTEREKDITLL